MIFDGENLFFNAKDCSGAALVSDVVKVGVGESYEPMKFFLAVAGTTEKTATVELQTSKDEAFSNPVTLATFSGLPISAPVPRGNLGYLRVNMTKAPSSGKVTAGLVLDDDIEKKD